jgi:hypothetical protein
MKPFPRCLVAILAAHIPCAAAWAQIDVTPVVPVVMAAPGTTVLVEALIYNPSTDVIHLSTASADVSGQVAGPGMFDEFTATRPDSLLPGESWQGPLIRLTLAPGFDVNSVKRVAVGLAVGLHPYDRREPVMFQFALNDEAAVIGVEPWDQAAAEILRVVPNPSRADARIVFELASAQSGEVRVFDVRGTVVRTLAQGTLSAGRHSFTWDGRTDTGVRTASGIYFVKLVLPNGTRHTKVVRIE